LDLKNLSLEEIDELRRQALIARSKEFSPAGFWAFFEYFHVIPLHRKGREWTESLWHFHEQGKGYLNEAHRESAKTTWTKFFLAFFIGHHPELSNMMVRINDEKSNETTQAIANIIEYDPRWLDVFPHVRPDKQKAWGANGYEVMRTDIGYGEWAEIKTALLPDPTLVGYGYKSGSIIGSRVNGVFVGDDVHDEINTSSDRQLASVKKWYTDTMSPCLMKGCWEIWDFTPWLDNDLYAYLKSTGAYGHTSTPLIIPAEDGEEWPADERIPLSGQKYIRYWPEAWDWERITDKYLKAGAIGFARMYQLDLEATKGINLKSEWLHKYDASKIDPSWPVYFGIDYASTMDKSKNKDRDYFAMSIARAIPGGGIVVIDGVRKHMSKGEAIQTVLAYMGIYPTLQQIGVESIGTGQEFYNDLLLANDMGGRIPPLIPITHGHKSKGERFENWLAPRCQAARIWFSNVETPFLTEFYNEWLSWPNGKHDDTIDSVYMCAASAEGRLLDKAERSFFWKKKQEINPYLAFGDNQ
jgi:phage terminase large subunit-like protein